MATAVSSSVRLKFPLPGIGAMERPGFAVTMPSAVGRSTRIRSTLSDCSATIIAGTFSIAGRASTLGMRAIWVYHVVLSMDVARAPESAETLSARA